MFNPSIKKAYIDGLQPNKRDKAERLFRKISEKEEELSMDVGDMGIDTLTEAINACNPQTYIMAFAIRRILIDYIDWRNKYLGQSNYINAAEMFNPLSCFALDETTQYFRNFDDVYQCLLSVYKPTDGLSCYPIACLAWAGLSADEIAELTNDDINFQIKTIHVRGRANGEFIECHNALVFELLRIYQNTVIGERTQNRKFYVELIDVGKFLKVPRSKNSKKENAPIKKAQIVHIINDAFKMQYQRMYQKDTHMTFEGLRMLGKINRLEELIDSFGSIRDIPLDKLYEYTQFSRTNWTVPMIEATLRSFKDIHNL